LISLLLASRWADSDNFDVQRCSRFLGLAFGFIAGCGAPAVSPVTFSVRLVEGADRIRVLDAAEAALIDQGFRIERRDPTSNSLRSFPLEGPASESGERTLRSRMSARRGIRRVAEVRVEDTPEGIRAACKVAVQQQTTQTHRFFARERAGVDAPEDTPIDRDAATTEEQNTVWQTVQRDRAAERAILDAILETVQRGP